MKSKAVRVIRKFLRIDLLAITVLFAGAPVQADPPISPFVAGTATGAIKVPRWQPYDFVFTNAAPMSNPFTVAFSATVKGPGNMAFITAGFYDGPGPGKCASRRMPKVTGRW